MNAFYHPNVKTSNILSEEESKHCVQVLRQNKGDEILLLDGKGGRFEAKIITTTKKSVRFEIQKSKCIKPKPFQTHLAIGQTKSMDRMEWLVEKLTEIGVDRISLFKSQNVERRTIRMDRLKKKAISALKQSQNPFLPVFHGLVDFKQLVNHSTEEQKLIAYVNNENTYIGGLLDPRKDTLVLIGPEGDFTKEEIQLGIANQFKPVSLGSNTLRTETAGLAVCCWINFVNGF